MADLILAFDFGGTKLTAAAITAAQLAQDASQWRDHRRVFSPPGADARSDIATMIRLGRELLGGNEAAAVGVSFGGPADYQTGLVRLSHHVPGWENTPLQRLLEEAFGAPARIDNDANAAALGEHRFGAGRGVQHLLYVTVSTGVGGGWILDGRPFRGHAGMAGEIGHTVVDPNGPFCLCGKRGCVERLASGPYMAQDLAEKLARPSGALSGRDVAKMAAAGNAAAQQILLRGARALGVGIGNAANLINPQRVVLGGGVTKSGDAWQQTVRRAARDTALPEITFDVVPAALGDDAPLWGAAALAVVGNW